MKMSARANSRISHLTGSCSNIDWDLGTADRGTSDGRETDAVEPPTTHISCAFNHHWQINVGLDGKFLDRKSLRQQLRESLGILPSADTAHYYRARPAAAGGEAGR